MEIVFQKILYAMAVYLQYVPAESFPFGSQVFQWHNLLGRTIDLYVIAVNNANEVVQAIFSYQHSGLPGISFVLFTVAHHTIHPAVTNFIYLHSQCHARGLA